MDGRLFSLLNLSVTARTKTPAYLPARLRTPISTASDFSLGFYLWPVETNHAAGAQLWAVLGDSTTRGNFIRTRWAACCVSQITVPELKVCAVNLERTRDAMSVDKASLMAADLSIAQAWGQAVQEHPAGFEAIKFSSRFLDQPCLALFDRGGLPARLQVKVLGPLSGLDAAMDWLDERKAALVSPGWFNDYPTEANLPQRPH